MGVHREEEEKIKAEAASGQVQVEELPNDVGEGKSVIPLPNDKISPSDEKALVPVPAAPAVEKHSGGSIQRDAMLAHVEQEKKLALIRAWEDSEKTKADNKAFKKLSSLESWENTKKAYVEAELKKMEEKLEKQKAKYTEKMRNNMAEIHRIAEEKRAMVEARRGEDILKVEEEAAKYRATGNTPKKFMGCCG